MTIIDGKKIAQEILAILASTPAPKKFFAGVLVGNDSASESFQTLKKKTAESLGVDYRLYEFPENTTTDTLREEVGRLARHRTCGGVIVQLPLPKHLNKHAVLNAIPPEKDPDVLSDRALGAFYNNRNAVLHPAAAVVEEIVKRTGLELASTAVAVMGPGFLVGKPVATWLIGRAKEVFILGRHADRRVLKEAGLIILGAGQAGMITADMLSDTTGVIDFGYSTSDTGVLSGDFDVRSISNNTPQPAFYTPTPGGTGPILVAKLLENFFVLNRKT